MVRVPVLSEQIIDALPKVSTAGSLLIMAFFLTILCTPIERTMVTIAGKPSGIAEVNEYIGKTMDAMNLKTYLLNYKNTKYSSEQQEQHENDKFEKALGLKPLTVAELKKIYRYNVENGAVVITGYKGNDNDVIIPETIGKSTVTCIDRDAFMDNKKIVSVTLPNTLKSIRNYAFYHCVNLQSIRIPDSVKFIMEKSFAGCTNLTIYAPAGSKAEKYAKKYNINFVAE